MQKKKLYSGQERRVETEIISVFKNIGVSSRVWKITLFCKNPTQRSLNGSLKSPTFDY
jgi:hypothetical protein